MEYVLRNSEGSLVLEDQSKNGITSVCPSSQWPSYGTLLLWMDYLDPAVLQSNNWSGEVRLWYSKTNGLYDAFDVLTGQKTRAIQLKLAAGIVNAVPAISLVGLPGRQVEVQTSADLKNWFVVGTVTLDQLGAGGYVPTALGAQGSRFVRGRILP